MSDDYEVPKRTRYSQRAFGEEIQRLLELHDVSLTSLAAELGLSKGHLSKLLSGKSSGGASRETMEEAAAFFDLPSGHFPEVRRAAVFEFLDDHPGLLDALFERYVDGEQIDERASIRLSVRRGTVG